MPYVASFKIFWKTPFQKSIGWKQVEFITKKDFTAVAEKNYFSRTFLSF